MKDLKSKGFLQNTLWNLLIKLSEGVLEENEKEVESSLKNGGKVDDSGTIEADDALGVDGVI